MKTLTQKQIRAAVLESRSTYAKVKITRDGEIHADSCPMPNTNKDGWVFVAHLEDVKAKGLDYLQ